MPAFAGLLNTMSYPPKIHQDNDIHHMVEVIKTYPLATLISVKNNEPLITHLPLVYNETGKLIGHIDKLNPQAALLKDNNLVTIISLVLNVTFRQVFIRQHNYQHGIT